MRSWKALVVLFSVLCFKGFAGITDNWVPLPASANTLLTDYRIYGRMLWAFDYGHSFIYEQLWRSAQLGDFDFSLIEGIEGEEGKSIFEQVQKILASPPDQAPAEESLAPQFTTDFSWVMDMFTWTHKLHWVVADVLAGETLPRAKEILKKQLEIYQRYPSLALPTKCKSMMYFMEGQPFSMRFRRSAPKANGLIWAYHYYQLAVNDALMIAPGPAREKALKDVLNKFRWMAEDPESNVPEMPLARQVSPNFYKEFPEIAAIFDNLHEYHDIVGDVLAADDNTYGNPKKKKAEMLRTMREIMDPFSFLIDCDKNGHSG